MHLVLAHAPMRAVLFSVLRGLLSPCTAPSVFASAHLVEFVTCRYPVVGYLCVRHTYHVHGGTMQHT